MPTVIEELIVDVRADTAKVQRSLADVQKQVANVEKQNQQLVQQNLKLQHSFEQVGRSTQNMSRSMQSAENAARRLVQALAIGAVIKFSLSLVDSIAQLGRLSQQTGISVERLSALRFAVEQTGIDFQVLEQAIRGFQQRMTEGLAVATSNVSIALRLLGLDVRDAQGHVQNLVDFLPQVADRFAQLQDGFQKSQLAVALFGEEAGPRLIPFLNQGSAGIARLVQRARELGVVLDSAAVRRAQEFNRALNELRFALTGVITELILLATPHLASAARTLVELIKGFNEWRAQVAGTSTNVNALDDQIASLQRRLAEFRGRAPFGIEGLLPPHIRAEIADLNRDLVTAIENRRRLLAMPGIPSGPGKVDPTTSPLLQPAPDMDAARRAMAQAQFDLEQLTARLTGQRTVLDELSIGWNTHADAVVEANRLIAEAYGSSAEAGRVATRLKVQLQLQEQEQILKTASLLASTLTAVFPKQKGAAIAAAIINTAVGITNALSTGFPPWNWMQAALIAASGAAQIAAIRSASPTGGGSAPTVGGGGAGGAGGGGGEDGGQMPTRLIIEPVDPAMIFTGRQLIELIEAINEEASNGQIVISNKVL